MIDPTRYEELALFPVTERCRYPSKFCRNRRSLKRNGELHRFCDHHRTKANLNQKRWSKNRRGGHVVRPENEVVAPPPMNATSPLNELSMDEMDPFESFTSMLMPQPIETPRKWEMGAEEQLGVFLRELLPPPEGHKWMEYNLEDRETILVEL